jgi:formiminotetrahydrofolate cyclodeaminase
MSSFTKVANTLHRGSVLTLAGITVYGMYLMGAVHNNTMERGRQELARRELETVHKKQTEIEAELAQAAQGITPSPSGKS